MIQAASRQSLTAEVWVRFRGSSCAIYGGQTVNWTGLSPSTSVVLTHIIQTRRHLNIITLRRTSGRSLGTFKQSSAFSLMGEHWIGGKGSCHTFLRGREGLTKRKDLSAATLILSNATDSRDHACARICAFRSAKVISLTRYSRPPVFVSSFQGWKDARI
jgi:hypothetical protein